MLSERRTRALRDLAARAGKAQTMEEACTLAAQTLSESALPQGSVASPAVVDLGVPQKSTWPLAEVARSGAQHVDDVETRFGHLSCGEYPESQKEALALPITPPGCERPWSSRGRCQLPVSLE